MVSSRVPRKVIFLATNMKPRNPNSTAWWVESKVNIRPTSLPSFWNTSPSSNDPRPPWPKGLVETSKNSSVSGSFAHEQSTAQGLVSVGRVENWCCFHTLLLNEIWSIWSCHFFCVSWFGSLCMISISLIGFGVFFRWLKDVQSKLRWDNGRH